MPFIVLVNRFVNKLSALAFPWRHMEGQGGVLSLFQDFQLAPRTVISLNIQYLNVKGEQRFFDYNVSLVICVLFQFVEKLCGWDPTVLNPESLLYKKLPFVVFLLVSYYSLSLGLDQMNQTVGVKTPPVSLPPSFP